MFLSDFINNLTKTNDSALKCSLVDLQLYHSELDRIAKKPIINNTICLTGSQNIYLIISLAFYGIVVTHNNNKKSVACFTYVISLTSMSAKK